MLNSVLKAKLGLDAQLVRLTSLQKDTMRLNPVPLFIERLDVVVLVTRF